MKNKYPIQVIDPSLQIDLNIPRKFQLFEEYRGARNIARFFLILIKEREI